MSKVSVIIPTYNSGHYIRDAIDSALLQSYENLEIIVMDDGSTDNTREIIADYIDNKKINYFSQKNAGLSAARNAGIGLSNGEHIALLDADDKWDKDKLTQQINLINSINAGMIFTDFHTFRGDKILSERKNFTKFNDRPVLSFEEVFASNNFIYPSTVLIKRDVFSICGLFDISLNAVEDYEMWLRIAQRFKIQGINSPLTLIRVHESNMSRDITRMLDNELKVIRKYKNDVASASYLRRKAKTFMLNADRAVHQSEYKKAMALFVYGFLTYPFIYPDVFIVLIKLGFGGKNIDRWRPELKEGWLKNIYLSLYRRY